MRGTCVARFAAGLDARHGLGSRQSHMLSFSEVDCLMGPFLVH